MKLPFTVEQFLEVFNKYNLAVWPMQIILYLLAVTAIFSSFSKFPYSDKLIIFILSFNWLWMGIAYHLVFFTAINKVAYIFGGIFIIQAVLFLANGILKNSFSFQFHKDAYGIAGATLIIYALIIYPLLGYFFGHTYPYAPTFGLPCPTTIFTLGMLLWNRQRTNLIILLIPLLWTLIGFTAAILLGIYEDAALVFAGLLTLTMTLIRNNGPRTRQRRMKLNF